MDLPRSAKGTGTDLAILYILANRDGGRNGGVGMLDLCVLERRHMAFLLFLEKLCYCSPRVRYNHPPSIPRWGLPAFLAWLLVWIEAIHETESFLKQRSISCLSCCSAVLVHGQQWTDKRARLVGIVGVVGCIALYPHPSPGKIAVHVLVKMRILSCCFVSIDLHLCLR